MALRYNNCGWTKLESSTQWELYRRTFNRLNGLGEGAVWLCKEPQTYPCLVDSYKQPGPGCEGRVASAFVYPGDAVALLEGLRPPEKAIRDALVAGPTQDDFNRSTTAHLMSIVHWLEQRRVVDRQDYEKVLHASLARVDQWRAADAEARQAAGNKDGGLLGAMP